MLMLAGAIIWAVLAAGLLRNYRWVAYLAFLAVLIGTLFAFGFALSSPSLVQFLFWGIFLTDLLAVAILFGILWLQKAERSLESGRARSF